MYFLNYQHTASNLSALIEAANVSDSEIKVDNIGSLYREFVATTRPIECPNNVNYTVSFENEGLGQFLQEKGIFSGVFLTIFESNDSDKSYFRKMISEAYNYIEKSDNKLAWIVKILVTDIVLFQSDRFGGGSTSHLPGIVCVSPKEDWKISDYAECLLHEATHLNLFLGDMTNGIFKFPVKRLGEEDARVVSAVRLGELRPLDKALHSAIVAVPLMYMQNINNENSLIDLFSDSILDCAKGLKTKTKFFTNYGNSLVDQLHDFALNKDFNKLKYGISSDEFVRHA